MTEPVTSQPPAPIFDKRSVQLSAPDAARLIRDAVAAGGEMWISGSGGSMHPTIRHADPVLVAPFTRHLRRGQVVLVPLGSRLMLHRVVDVQGDIVLTRGDARQRNDTPIGKQQLVARALAVRQESMVTALVLTLRFGLAPLVRFVLNGTYRRVRRLQAALRREH
ncbi:MAG TPA: S24/S26 family peptidase [Gemmatimonadaceae bacterium]|nr:S24/S26 family peptidase [Gemmatimonadaceae bacterium]